MSLKEIRLMFLGATGRADLVGPTGANRGADRLINSGQRWLDQQQRTPKTRRKYCCALQRGTYIVTVPDCRVVREVTVANADGRTYLDRKQRKALLEHYPESLLTGSADGVLVAKGEIKSWLRQVFVADGSSYEFQVDHDFVPGQVLVTADKLMQTPELDFRENGTDKIQFGSVLPSGVEVVIFYQAATPVYSESSTQVTSSYTGLDQGRPLYFCPAIIDLAPSQSEYTEDDFESEYDWHEIQAPPVAKNVRGVLTFPPADKHYTLWIEGDFYSETLVDEDDTSYWSEVQPDLLVQAAVMRMEESLGNTTRRREIEAQILRDLHSIERDMVAEEIHGIKGIEG